MKLGAGIAIRVVGLMIDAGVVVSLTVRIRPDSRL